MWKKFNNNRMWLYYDSTWTTTSIDNCLGQVSSEYFEESYLIVKPAKESGKSIYYFCSQLGEYSFCVEDVESISVMCATETWTKYHMQFKNKKIAIVKAINKSSINSFDRHFGDLMFKDEPIIKCPNCGKKIDGYKKFCGYCATKIEIDTPSFCTKCGAKLVDGLCPDCEKVTHATIVKEKPKQIPLSKKMLLTHWIAGGINLLGIITNIIVALAIDGQLNYMYTCIGCGFFAGFIFMLVGTPILIYTLRKIVKFNNDRGQYNAHKGTIKYGYVLLILPWLLAIMSIFC